MQERVLIVEDDQIQLEILRKILDRNCHVVGVTTLRAAHEELAKNSFDLILLDVSLPDGDGFSFFTEIKMRELTSGIPVVFITAKSDVAGELMGFSLGAEDYVVKPVDPLRLKARLEARLRSIRERQHQELTLRKGSLKLSVSLHRAAIVQDGQETVISLTPVEFKLLFHFLRYEDHVFTREQLLTAIWNNASEVFDRTVDMHVSKLRKKISPSEFQIKAVHGMGYRLSREKAIA